MSLRSTIDWFQLATLVAVFVGLVLVVYELRQARDLTRVQLSAEGWNRKLDQSISLMGENLAAALAKHCRGDNLSDEERIQVSAYLDHIWTRGDRLRVIENVGEFGTPITSFYYGIMQEYLALPMGRSRFESRGQGWPEYYRTAAEEVIARKGYLDCAKHYELEGGGSSDA